MSNQDIIERIADEIAAWRNDTLDAFGLGTTPNKTTEPDRSLARRLVGLLSDRERGLEEAAEVVENFVLAVIPDQCTTRESLKYQREELAKRIRSLKRSQEKG